MAIKGEDIKAFKDLLEQSKSTKGIKGFAKKLTYAILIIILLAGLVGAYGIVKTFIMDDFIRFIEAFAWLFIPFILSIGANSAIDRREKNQLEKTKVVTENARQQSTNVS